VDPRGRYGQVRKRSLSPGFNPRTVQLVASRYTDYAIPAHTKFLVCSIIIIIIIIIIISQALFFLRRTVMWVPLYPFLLYEIVLMLPVS